MFLALAIGMGAVLALLVVAYCRKNKEAFRWHSPLVLIFLSLLLAIIIPVSFPVSTRTSETDRLLYFPSVWICLLIAFLIFHLCRHRYLLFIAIFWTLGASVYFLDLNQRNWREASRITRSTLSQLKQKTGEGRAVVLINLPDEHKGAFIFRMGFQEALLMDGIDTSRVKVINLLKPQDQPDPVRLTPSSAQRAQLPPGIELLLSEDQLTIRKGATDRWKGKVDQVAVGYWDKQDWQWIDFPFNNVNE